MRQITSKWNLFHCITTGRIVVRLRCGLVFTATCKATQVILGCISNVFTMLKYEAHLHSAKAVQSFLKQWFTLQKESFFLSRGQPQTSLWWDIACIFQWIWTVAGNAELDPKWLAQGACLANLMEAVIIHLWQICITFVGFFRSSSRVTDKERNWNCILESWGGLLSSQ